MESYIGRLLDDRYEILEMIGSGGMAVVYKARCNRLNRLVAIKILKTELSKDEEFRRRFHAESQAVAMLSHPNIVSVYDVSHSDNVDYIVMELIEGITLRQYMEQKKVLNWREALHFAMQIAKAMEHAHSRGIIHRDIKPHNIMILKDGSVKVADFGIAQISSAQNTLTREALGSVHYISPEQARGAHVDARSDLYSLGVVLYEMLTGRPPFDGDSPVSVAIQHINATAALPRSINPSIPLGLEQITMHAMTADLDKRYESATQMLADLEEFRKNPNITFDFSRPRDDVDFTRLLHQPTYHREQTASTRKSRLPEQDAPPQTHPSPTAARDRAQKASRTAVIAGIVCIALALLGIFYFLYSYFFSDLFSRTEEDVVPNFLGLYYEDIDPNQYPNFSIEIRDWKTSDVYEMGYVIDQTPVGNRTAKVGTTIQLTISAGADSINMPNLINASLQSALSMLGSMSVDVETETVYQPSDVYTDGYIISTDPVYGEPLREGQTVILYVSQGAQDMLVPVPSLVGLDVESAAKLITDAGLIVGSSLAVDSDLQEGTVTFQSIEPEEMVKKGTVINLQISKGPVKAAVPEVTFLSDDQVAFVGDSLVVVAEAESEDDGVLTYAWYMSANGSTDDAQLVSPSSERNTSCVVDTTVAGTYYYFCRIVNTLGEESEFTYSDMIRVIVEENIALTEKDIIVQMPSSSGRYLVAVYVEDKQCIAPFTVNMDTHPDSTITLTVSGSGVQMVHIFVDGQEYDSQLIDFDTVG